MSRMHLPLWLKILWTIWIIAWAPLYWRQYGAQNFLYFCDLGNFLIAVRLWLERPLIFSWQATGLLLFQTLFAADLLGAFLTGKHWIGGTEFMFDAHLPLFLRLLSLFHVVTPPLLLWAIWRLGYDKRGWKLQALTTWIVVPINYLWRPEQDVKPGLSYLLLYLLAVPILVYWPTHLILRHWAGRRNPSIVRGPKSC